MPRRVYWLNPVTEERELCAVKSLKTSEASTHSDGWAGYHEDAVREVAAMRRVAGLQGVTDRLPGHGCRIKWSHTHHHGVRAL
jgi:hypothetical protein